MTFFLVASGASLTIGIGLGCLIVALRDAFKHEAQAASVPLSLNAPRPGAYGVAAAGSQATPRLVPPPRPARDTRPTR